MPRTVLLLLLPQREVGLSIPPFPSRVCEYNGPHHVKAIQISLLHWELYSAAACITKKCISRLGAHASLGY
jgi:hypothetical protein